MKGKPAAVKHRPIIFTDVMVKALNEGRKTQTRRVIWPPPGKVDNWVPPGKLPADMVERDRVRPGEWAGFGITNAGEKHQTYEPHPLTIRCPYGLPGDRLYVRETWALLKFYTDYDTGFVDDLDEWKGPLPDKKPEGWELVYRGDGWWEEHIGDRGFRWRQSRFMPRWAARIILELTGVRVQRLQDISSGDVQAEGCTGSPFGHAADRMLFPTLWDSLNVKGKESSWQANPWVWVLSFRVVKS